MRGDLPSPDPADHQIGQRPSKRLLIVDGYNVLRSGGRYHEFTLPEYHDYDGESFNEVREKLLNDVALFAGRDYEAVIVYDGGGNEYSTGELTKVGGVSVIFSASGLSADKVIEKLARDARRRFQKALVVTSDATIQDTVFGGGVDRMSADGFGREVAMLEHDAAAELPEPRHERRTLEGRLSPDAAARLRALRDQLSS